MKRLCASVLLFCYLLVSQLVIKGGLLHTVIAGQNANTIDESCQRSHEDFEKKYNCWKKNNINALQIASPVIITQEIQTSYIPAILEHSVSNHKQTQNTLRQFFAHDPPAQFIYLEHLQKYTQTTILLI